MVRFAFVCRSVRRDLRRECTVFVGYGDWWLALTGEGFISSSTYTVPLPWDAHKKSIKKIEADEGIEFPQFDWLWGANPL